VWGGSLKWELGKHRRTWVKKRSGLSIIGARKSKLEGVSGPHPKPRPPHPHKKKKGVEKETLRARKSRGPYNSGGGRNRREAIRSSPEGKCNYEKKKWLKQVI